MFWFPRACDGCVYTTLQQPLPVLLERNSSVFSILQKILVGLQPLISPAHLLSSGSADPTGPDGSRKTKGKEGRGLIHIFQENKKERKGKKSRRETCAFFVLAQGSLGHALKLSRRVRKASQGLSFPRPCVGWSRSVVIRTDDTRASLSVCARGPSVCTRLSLLRVSLRLADCCLCRYSASDAPVSDLRRSSLSSCLLSPVS